ncbi:hypothetical protein EZL74_03050 [Flavobacterium silvisoli]|uniref:FUSC family protein n=1 Tax=Flavobacterium silvisoli TaxID=2529433 RepID=A0A4Q9Z2T0_9FLAO|nr:hypothetical protein [Flavobacterium silvisoli]TBX70666.1 hypothetical protein EZL74_03050 [Flavobacterium silvisoli]
MRKLFLIPAVVFTVLAIVFSVMPMDTLAFLPIGLAIVFSLLVLRKSEAAQKNIPKWLLIISVICSVYVLGKTFLVKDEVAQDQTFEKEKIENNKESKKELEELEGLE